MEAVSIPFLPAGLWLLATASSILIVLVVFGMHIYQRQRFKTALIVSGEVAELASQKEQLQADVMELRSWISKQKEELERLISEREDQERLRGELTRLQNDCFTEEQRIIEIRKETGELENQRYTLSQNVNKLSLELEHLTAQRRTLEDLQSQINAMQSNLETAQRELNSVRIEADALLRQTSERRIELEVIQNQHDMLVEKILANKQELSRLDNTLAIYKQELEKLRTSHEIFEKESKDLQLEIGKYKESLSHKSNLLKEISSLEEKLDQYQDVTEQLKKSRGLLDGKLSELTNVRQELDLLTRQAVDRRIELDASQIHQNRVSETIERLTEECASLSEISKDLNNEKVILLAELERIKGNLSSLQEAERKLKRLEHEANVLKDDIAKLQEEKFRSSGNGGEGEDPYADLLKNMPSCLVANHTTATEMTQPDEERVLDEVRSKLEQAGYHFHKRVVKAFHTALKCHDINPLTVLAGVSGTGKTLLPAAYAQLMGMHSLVIAVQPRWDSPQDMFGFYNYLEKKYKATDLARALIRMDPFNTIDGLDKREKRVDRMLLVLLDEMNLARTEYYFSEFLSKLEFRRLSGPSLGAGYREHSKILLDTGPGRNPIPFWVGKNVLFAGTMNEDETTQTLSDKVLDRANVLRFGRPAKKINYAPATPQTGPLPAPLGYLTASHWEGWCKNSATVAPWSTNVECWIDELNDGLTKIGRPFGHRVSQSIMTYVANYPGVTVNDTYKEAFADQIEQKILPKLRGLDTMEGNTVFDEVKRIIDKTGDDTLGKAFEEAQSNKTTGMFLWHGVTRQD